MVGVLLLAPRPHPRAVQGSASARLARSATLGHADQLRVLLVSVRMVHDETELSFLVLGGSGGDVAGL